MAGNGLRRNADLIPVVLFPLQHVGHTQLDIHRIHNFCGQDCVVICHTLHHREGGVTRHFFHCAKAIVLQIRLRNHDGVTGIKGNHAFRHKHAAPDIGFNLEAPILEVVVCVGPDQQLKGLKLCFKHLVRFIRCDKLLQFGNRHQHGVSRPFLLLELGQNNLGIVGQGHAVILRGGHIGLLLFGEPLAVNLNVLLQEDGNSGQLVLGILGFRAVRLQLDDGTQVILACSSQSLDLVGSGQRHRRINLCLVFFDVGSGDLDITSRIINRMGHQPNFLGLLDPAAGNLANGTIDCNTGLELVSGQKVRILQQGGLLGGVDKHHLFNAVFLVLELGNSVHNTAVGNARQGGSGINIFTLIDGIQHITVNFAGNGLRKLGLRLANGIAKAAVYGLLGNANGLHGLFDGEGGAGSGQGRQANFRALCHVLGITNVVPTGNGLGITGNAYQGSVNLGIGGQLQQRVNLRANHRTHHFRVNHVRHLGYCHNNLPRFRFCVLAFHRLTESFRIFFKDFGPFGIRLFQNFRAGHRVVTVMGIQLVFDDVLLASLFKLRGKLRPQGCKLVIPALDLAVFVKLKFAFLLQFEGQVIRIKRFGRQQFYMDRGIKLRLRQLCLKLCNLAFIVGDFLLKPFIALGGFFQFCNQAACLGILLGQAFVFSLQLAIPHIKVFLTSGEDFVVLHFGLHGLDDFIANALRLQDFNKIHFDVPFFVIPIRFLHGCVM
nr:MAG TPA: hypothetical protein [Caudoviricetes sp.]